jgi:hypothetical protein
VKGEPRISLVVLNDDTKAQSRGSSTTIDHRMRTTWEMTAARRSPGLGFPTVSVASRSRPAVVAVVASAVTAGLPSHGRR